LGGQKLNIEAKKIKTPPSDKNGQWWNLLRRGGRLGPSESSRTVRKSAQGRRNSTQQAEQKEMIC